MSTHEWTDPKDLLLYRSEPGAIRRPLSRETWEGMIYSVLSREILRLAEDNEELTARADLLDRGLVSIYAILVPGDGVPAEEGDLTTVCVVRIEQAQERERLLAEEVERLRAGPPEYLRVGADAARAERSRIRKALLTEMSEWRRGCAGGQSERVIGADAALNALLLALDRVCPEEC